MISMVAEDDPAAPVISEGFNRTPPKKEYKKNINANHKNQFKTKET
jgi:hypothetical protein